jgi:hypothetical protein
VKIARCRHEFPEQARVIEKAAGDKVNDVAFALDPAFHAEQA